MPDVYRRKEMRLPRHPLRGFLAMTRVFRGCGAAGDRRSPLRCFSAVQRRVKILPYRGVAKHPDNLEGTSKNSPFALWSDLLIQQFLSESPQYTKYSGLSETFVGSKSLAQIIKKEFLEVALDFQTFPVNTPGFLPRFGGLPHQPAGWFAMTSNLGYFFDSLRLKSEEWRVKISQIFTLQS